jgi:hypothetical protein
MIVATALAGWGSSRGSEWKKTVALWSRRAMAHGGPEELFADGNGRHLEHL